VTRVLIDALSARQGGGQTYIINLLQALPAEAGLEVLVAAPTSLPLPDARPEIRRLEVHWPVTNPLLRGIWQRWILRRVLRRMKADVLFVPGGVVLTRVPPGCRLVTMFRNMIPFDMAQRARYPLGYQRLRNWILAPAMLQSMVRSNLVIFLSEYARQVVEALVPGRIHAGVVIPHGVNEAFRGIPGAPLPRPSWLPAGPYLLYVSTLDFYKAQLEVVRGFALVRQRRNGPERLVLIGPENPRYGRLVRDEIARLGLEDQVIVAGNVPYRELPAVYQNAVINLFASESENCPNILLEALASGRPVLSSCMPPMPEFGGDAALYFDPRSPEALAKCVLSVLDDPRLLAELSVRATARALRYRWSESGRRTWEAIAAVARCAS
jgi:glycosyltransferase involved in cell wall biosynthesis